MKKLVSIILIFSILSTQAAIPQKAYAWWWSSEPQPMNKDLRFETLYPGSFWSSTTGQVLKYTSIAAVVGVITYFPIGTAAITAVSALVAEATPGGVSLLLALFTGSWMDVLAWFSSYFAVQSIIGSSFAVIASVTALCAVGDLAIAGAIHLALNYAADKVTTGTHRDELDLIKPALFYGFTSPAVKDDLKALKKALDTFSSKPDQNKAREIVSLLEKIDRRLTEINNKLSPDDTTAYNYLLSAIIRYDLEQYSAAKSALDLARQYTAYDKSSVLDYIDALLSLQNEDTQKATQLLQHISAEEPKVAVPYIVLAQLYTKQKNHLEAFRTLDRGIKNSGEEKCVMNWMAGNSLYNLARYEEAIPYYKTALRNMTVNEYEAIYKLCIAKCYKKMGDNMNGIYWLNDAFSEVKGNQKIIDELEKQYFAD